MSWNEHISRKSMKKFICLTQDNISDVNFDLIISYSNLRLLQLEYVLNFFSLSIKFQMAYDTKL